MPVHDPKVDRSIREAAELGKLLPEDLYVRAATLDELPVALRDMVAEAQEIAGRKSTPYNVLKIGRDGRRVSFLNYPTLDTAGLPTLARTAAVDLEAGTVRIIDYTGRTKPPVFHRKELLSMPTKSKKAKAATSRKLVQKARRLSAELSKAGFSSVYIYKKQPSPGVVKVRFGGWALQIRRGSKPRNPFRYKVYALVKEGLIEITWVKKVASGKTPKAALAAARAKGLRPRKGDFASASPKVKKGGAVAKRKKAASSRPKAEKRKSSKTKRIGTTRKSMNKFVKVFREVRAKMAKRFKPLLGVGLVVDPSIHDSPRHFAKTGDSPILGGVVVTVAPELGDEKASVMRGIAAHELAHAAQLLGYAKMPTKSTKGLPKYDRIERQADRIAKKLSGWTIYYDGRGVELAGRGAKGKKLRPKGLK